MILSLPYPPSINHYWRHNRGRTHISAEGKFYRERILARLLADPQAPLHGRLEGRLAVTILVSPPDNRRRDLDNVQKALFDALQHAGLYRDDEQIDDIHIMRRCKFPGGMVMLTIEQI